MLSGFYGQLEAQSKDISRVYACYERMMYYFQNVENGNPRNSNKNILNLNFKQDVIRLEQSIGDSYNCWLTPWNWTDEQKNLYDQIRIISVLTLYSDLVELGDDVTGTAVVHSMRKLFFQRSDYPLVYGYQFMVKHRQFISSLKMNEMGDELRYLLKQRFTDIENFKNLLLAQDAYVQEVQVKKMYEMQKEMIEEARQNAFNQEMQTRKTHELQEELIAATKANQRDQFHL